MRSPVRIGVLGCADIARRRMLPALAAVEDTEIAAVASRDVETAARTAMPYGCRVVADYAELVTLPDVEAVYVPLPVALHAPWVEAALRAGKHVLAEKPLTTDPERSRALFALARRSGLVLWENVMFVHHAQHTAVRRLVADGVIGELRSFHAAFAVPRRPDGDIRLVPELGGGALWDVGVYPVRAAVHFLGAGLRVAGAVLTRDRYGREVDTAGGVLLRTADGVVAHLEFGLDHAYGSSYTLWGSEGRVTVEHAFTPPAGHRPVLRVVDRTGPREIVLEPDDQVANTVRGFARAVRAAGSGSRPLPVGRAEEASLLQADLLAEVLHRAGLGLAPARPSLSGTEYS
ncbi:Gfo/Idh/MocA family protein [Streptomyces sp. NBC_00582]|uniref:Gfo/Idh/MocA family protein n=1 Tax=Streptomyces sp. NBC_00582 TaxID=2975783 RepID=UPI0010645113|nr:Gfo/Idh/MocA family oxidoreductase [Streptomyces sp. NBC_00582]WUB65124.1 Gfo/Idh/MocA family oxidoreductase [Streptomyces sp. NBC_00582]